MTTLHPPIYTVFVNNYTKLHGVTTQSLPEYICMHACSFTVMWRYVLTW